MRKLRRYPTPPHERIGLSLLEVCGLTGLGLHSIRSAINAGLLPSHKLGRRVIVRRDDVDKFLKRLPTG
jgi:excisionase family DNA binding protein